MKQKYNIAFTPVEKKADFIGYAERFYSIADGYKLGENSLPHVTVCQFYSEESDIKTVWEKVCTAVQEHFVSLTFNQYSCGLYGQFNWISLLPKESEVLNQLHQTVANIVPNPTTKNYDPHLTLINTLKEKEDEFKIEAARLSNTSFSLEDTFVLSLGKSDPLGQFTEIIYQCEAKSSFNLRR